VSISAVAFVPAAPLLIPAVAGGSADLDGALRAASLGVVARALAGRPGRVVVVARVPSAGQWSQDSTWDFAGFGVPRRPADARPRLPWALGVGAWLLDECGWDGPRRYVGVDGSPDALATAKDLLVDSATSMVVVGDGSACRSERAPGHLDDRAEPFDRAVAEALAQGDAAGLGDLDSLLAKDLMCGGADSWRWVAAALGGAVPIDADLVSRVAPYGVGYFVALWSFA
jgi:hypothetical protein